MPRKQIKDQRKIELIEANIASIAKHGLTETTITHVSGEAGMSRGIISFYFDGKEAMMQSTLAHMLDQMEKSWRTHINNLKLTKEDKLQKLIEVHFNSVNCSHRRLSVLIAFLGHASSHKEYKELVNTYDLKLQEAFKTLMPRASDTLLPVVIKGLWLQLALAPKAMDRKLVSALCLSMLNIKASAKPVKVKGKGKAKTSAAKPIRQMDFEDLLKGTG
jgi:TetR/AcrR family transcriptional repressor of bet genes